jgi:methyl-accepting chemotaxis protein
MKQIFAPGALLLNRLKFSKKFMFLFIIFIISLGTIGSFYIRSLEQKTNFVEKERIGLLYIENLLNSLYALQKHREYSVIYLAGDPSVEPKLKETEKGINETVKRIEVIHKQNKDLFPVSEQWKAFQESWKQIEQNWSTFTTEETVKRHNIMINDLTLLMTMIADRSNLTLDNNIDNNYLVRLIVDKVPYITELIGATQAFASEMAINKKIDENGKAKLTYLLNSLESSIISLNNSTVSIFRENKTMHEKFNQYKDAVMTETFAISNVIDSEFLRTTTISIEPNIIYDKTNGAHEQLFKTAQFGIDILKKAINQEYNSLNADKWKTIAVIVFVSMIIVYLFSVFYRSIRDHIDLIETVTKQAAKGDLTVRMNVHTKDEFAQIAASFNSLIESFRDIISVNQQLVEEVSASSQELTAITEETMQATSQVAVTMEEVAKGTGKQLHYAQQNTNAIQSLMKDTHYISERAKQVASSSVEMNNEAAKGTASVHEMIGQMRSVNELVSQSTQLIRSLYERSNNIGQMTQMITTIAEQTNLLALNAAIEAARAGDHGKGFAVVANEVRKLAEQSSQSAKHIHMLLSEIQKDTSQSMTAMEHVLQEAQKGVSVANDTGTIFEKILEATHQVTEQINEVSSRLTWMETSLQGLVSTIHETENISQQSEQQTQAVAAASEQLLASMQEISSSVQSLNDKAQDLFQAVEQFKL